MKNRFNRRQEETNSRLGIASFIVSLSAVIFFILAAFLSFLSSENLNYEDYIIQIILSAGLGYASVLVGLGLGIACMAQKNASKLFGFISLLINLVIIFIWLMS